MRIIFMGTPDFAVPCLERLIENKHNVVGVFTQPDKPVGRKQILTPPPVKTCAVEHKIPVYQPKKIKGSNALDIINSLNPDILVVVAYGKILPVDILNAPRFGAINVHASLLPYYRGAAPIQWAVLNGDEKTGVTIMQMDEGLDTGDILLVKETNIDPNETSEELFDKLSLLGSQALIEALDKIENSTIERIVQPTGDFGYAKMITKDLCQINWNKSAFEVHNKVRGLQSWPCAITKINNINVKVHKTIISDVKGNKAGEVVENNNKLIVCCGDNNCVEILELQPENKRRMTAKAFLQGNKVQKGQILGE